jgi:hypothetical protein
MKLFTFDVETILRTNPITFPNFVEFESGVRAAENKKENDSNFKRKDSNASNIKK